MNRVFLSLCLCLVLGCVTRTEFLPYQESVDHLEKETNQLGKRIPEFAAALETVREDQANMKADMIDVRTEMQRLRGELSSGLHQREVEGEERQSVEESVALQLNYLQQQMQATEARLARIEDYFGLKPLAEPSTGRTPLTQRPEPRAQEGAGPAPPPAAGGGAVLLPAPAVPEKKDLSADEAYEMAYHLFQANENDAARKAFDQFIQRYPDSSLVDNALFWIGETHYRVGDYENAVMKYQEVIKKYPKGSKGPDALLKMGYALEKMNEPEAAVAAMEKLVKAYPKAPQAKLATRKIEQLKSN